MTNIFENLVEQASRIWHTFNLRRNDPDILTSHFIDKIHVSFQSLVAKGDNQHEIQSIKITTPHWSKEALSSSSSQTLSRYRFLIYTSFQALSVRGGKGIVEIFMVPTNDLVIYVESELPSRLKLQLKLADSQNLSYWTLDGFPMEDNEIEVLVKSLYKDLMVRSQSSSVSELSESRYEGGSLIRSVRALVVEKQGLLQKIVNQQEQVQNRIARDLHDAVIGNVMMLKRSFKGGPRLSDSEFIDVLDEIVEQLQDICQDLTPRNLKDWGLKTMVKDLLTRTAERTNAKYTLRADGEMPDFPEEVDLHLFRIAQETLNNIEKYAEASEIVIEFKTNSTLFEMSIRDNGKGFSESAEVKDQRQGRGTSNLRERAELIQTFFPTHVTLDSQPNVGTTMVLQLTLK